MAKVKYRDYAAWEDELLKSQAIKEHEKYWIQVFSDDLPVLNMPTDYPRPKIRTFEGESISFEIDKDLSEKIREIGNASGATLYMTLLAAYNVLLSRYSGQEDIVIGSPIAGRHHADLHSIVGMFVNLLAMRSYPKGDKTFKEFLEDVKENALSAYEHQDYQFDKLVEKLNIPRDLSRNPLFDITFVLQNTEVEEVELGDISLETFDFDNEISKFDLTLSAFEIEGGIGFNLRYWTKLFKRETVERIAKHFVSILREVAENPEIRLSEIEMLSKEEKRDTLVVFNDTKVEYPGDKTIYELFQEQVENTPDNIAVVHENKELNYRQLNERANSLARILRKKGVDTHSIVGIMAERSVEMIVGIMGILKAGAAYLPIDSEYPQERIEYMLKDSNVNILLVQGKPMDRFDGILMDLDNPELYEEVKTNLDKVSMPRDIAYVIYTSGSTGNPKGVMVTNQGLVNYIWWAKKVYVKGEKVDFPLYSSISFDLTVTSIYPPLITGNKIVVYDDEDKSTLVKRIIEEDGADIIKLTPTHLNLLRDLDLSKTQVKRFIVGGEDLKADLARKIHESSKGRIEIYNEYGPTETVVGCMIYKYNPEKNTVGSVPIGAPADNAAIYILDKYLNPVPVGTSGEIYIAGDGLARGYLNNEELTQEKFIENPFIPGEKMYRTGDLARRREDGNIEYVGRIDHQVKIRGYRIELGEIEGQLLKHEEIKEAVVVDKEDEERNKYLAAYIVCDSNIVVSQLREYLSKKLPGYMVPSYFIQMERLPLTSNGKIDRKKLPEPGQDINTGVEYIAPRNEIEEKLEKIWSKLLKTKEISIDSDFFDLGGHSLKVTKLIAEINKEFNVEISFTEVFDKPTIRNMGEYIVQAKESIYSSIRQVEEREVYKVSSAQKRLFALNQFAQEEVNYNTPAVMTIEGRLEKERVEKTFRKLVERHEAFRTSFELQDDEIVQRVHKEIEFNIEYMEVCEDVVTRIVDRFIKPFDLSKAPLLRIKLLQIEEEKYILMVDMHHIISDGASVGIIMEEFAKLYNGDVLEELKIQYKDYAAWQNELLDSGAMKNNEEYWLTVFGDEIPVLDMPTDYLRPTLQSFEGDSIIFKLDKELTEKIKELGNNNGATLYMILLSTYNILLSRYSGQEDIIVGSPIAGRPHADLQSIVGMFVNTLAMRNYPKGDKTFKKFLEDVKKNALDAYEHQDYQFDELVEKLDIRRDLSRNALFDTMFVMQNTDIEELEINGLIFKPYGFENKISKVDLTLSAVEIEGEVMCNLEYCTRLFKRETVERISQHFINILRVVAENPEIGLLEIEMLSKEEKRKILVDFNDTKKEYPEDKTIYELFQEQVKKAPENIAVVYEDKALTYGQLNEKANCLARVLRERGVGPDTIVGIMVERSLEMIVGIMGVLKAGGAYLPIDPEYPQERIEYMLKDSNTKILLTQKCFMNKVKLQGTVIDLEEEGLYEGNKENLEKINTSRNLAYIIYTSGSTGKPKGVMIEHRSVINLVNWYDEKYNIKHNKNTMQMTNITFDVAVEETIGVLLNGGTIYIPLKDIILDKNKFRDYVNKNGIDIVQFVPITLNELIAENEFIEGINIVMCGGDKLDGILKNKVMSKGYILYNHYGPTETTVHSITTKCCEQCVIGKPINNTQIYILDKANNVSAIGIKGEICISGAGLARGYLNRPELTQERFVANPFIPGERIYRTGDIGRWLTDGTIEFIGRIDHQVKIRGFRIEPGEIENQLLKNEAIKETVVIARENNQGNKYLCAYIVCDSNITVSELRSSLLKELPDYMIPQYFIELEKMPLTSSGKIDRRALPEPDGDIITGVEYIPPRNEIEEKLVKVWSEVLGVERIGIDDDFFALGGDSIKAVQASARLGRYKLKVIVSDLFAKPTVRELSTCVKQEDKEIDQGAVEGKVELTAIQKWFFEQDFTNMHYWNQSVMLYSKDGFDEEIVKRVFSKIVEHHDALRIAIENQGNELVQYNRDVEDRLIDLSVIDFGDKASYQDEIEKEAVKIQASIDLSHGPLVKLGLFKTKDGDHLLIVIHHLVVDGISWRILFEDFATGYRQVVDKQEIDLPPKTHSFKEWAENIQKYSVSSELLGEVQYWRNIENTKVGRLPKDYETTSNKVSDSSSIEMRISKEYTDKLLRNTNKAYNTEINDVLLAALGLAIKEWTGENKVLVSLEGHGREDIIPNMNITRTIGWFTSIYPVILDCEKSYDIGYYVKVVKEGLRKIPNKGVGYNILKYITPKEYISDLEFKLNPQISFNYLGQFDNDVDKGVFNISSISTGDDISKESNRLCDININGMIIGDELSLSFEYNKDEYDLATITELVEGYKKVLLNIIQHCVQKEETEMTPSDFDYKEISIEELEMLKMNSNGRIENIYTLSPMQEGILFHKLLGKDKNAYFEQLSFRIVGSLDIELFEKSINKLIEKHDVLRTIFIYENRKRPLQLVLKEAKIKICFEDISSLVSSEKSVFIKEFKEKDIDKGFDLSKEISIRASLIKTSKEEHIFILSTHHIILDGWSSPIMFQDFFKIYNALKENRHLKLSKANKYSNYIKWLEKQDKKEALSYWRKYLENYQQQAQVPKVIKPVKENSYVNNDTDFIIDSELTDRLKNMARRNKVTVNTVFQTIWGILLQRYNNTTDVVFGAVVSGRPAEINGIENMVGVFINTVPVRIKNTGDKSFAELVKEVQDSVIKTKSYEYVPLAEIQSNTSLKQRLIDNIMIFHNYPAVKYSNKSELKIKLEKVVRQNSYNFNIMATMTDKLFVKLSYNASIHDERDVNMIASHIKQIIEEVTIKPEIKISEIEILSPEKKRKILVDFNDTRQQLINSYSSNIEKLVSDRKIYIIGENNRLQPIGVVGELCISEEGLSSEDLNKLNLTEEKLIDNPFEPGKRMYPTGEFARWLSDGSIDCIERIGCTEELPEPNENVYAEEEASNSEIEEKLRKIWSEVLELEVKEIEADDGFFELGGHSIHMTQLVFEIYEEFGIEMDFKRLYQFNTLRKVAKMIEEEILKETTNSTVHAKIDSEISLLNEGEEANIFVFPPISTYGISYKYIADLLSEYSVYAFNYIEDDDKVEKYVGMIKEIQKDGPYIVMAYSAGGLLAFEAAKALLKDGNEVAGIILIDTYPSRKSGYQEVAEDDVDKVSQMYVDHTERYMEDVKNEEYEEYSELSKLFESSFFKKVLKRKMTHYKQYLADLDVWTEKIKADIYHIISEEASDEWDDGWDELTEGQFIKFYGYGKHSEMVNKGIAEKNVEIVREILSKIS